METIKTSVGGEKISGCRVRSKEGEQGTEDCYSNKTIPYASLVNICHYTFLQTQMMYNIKRNLSVNYRLWIIMTSNVGSSIITNVALRCRM